MDLNKFFEDYVESNTHYVKEKTLVLEEFKNKEDTLRGYEESLSELQKISSSARLDDFSNIKEKLTEFLFDFNTEDILSNINNIEYVNHFIKTREKDLIKLSESFNFIRNTWISFLERRNPNELPSVFIEEIQEKIQLLYSDMCNTGAEDITRIEENAESLRTEILKIINIFEDFNMKLEKNVFIGEDAKLIESEIEDFINISFYKESSINIYKQRDSLMQKIELLEQRENSFERASFEVVRVENKDINYYYYTIDINGFLLPLNGDIDYDNVKVTKINKFIYIDGYPTEGIFEIQEIKDKLKLSKAHYELMDEFNRKSLTTFLALSSVFAISSLFFIFDKMGLIMLLSVLVFVYLSFLFYFRKTIESLEKKYKIVKSFFFFPVDFFIIKEGDYHFNFDNIIISILMNADNTILKKESKKSGR